MGWMKVTAQTAAVPAIPICVSKLGAAGAAAVAMIKEDRESDTLIVFIQESDVNTVAFKKNGRRKNFRQSRKTNDPRHSC
jgi:hypothetical protein